MLNVFAGQLEDARGVAGELSLEVPRLTRERGPIDADAGALHVGQDRHERHLELAIDRLEAIASPGAAPGGPTSCRARSARSPA